MNRNRITALAGLVAVSASTLAMAPVALAQAAPARPAISTTYTAAPSASWTYTAPGIKAKITITQVADVLYRVSITGQMDAKPRSVPASMSNGLAVPVRAFQMPNAKGTMTLGARAATFTLARSYTDNYYGPYSFVGGWDVVVTTGETSTQTITVGGRSYTIGVKAPKASGYADATGRRIMQKKTFEVDYTTLTNPVVTRSYFRADDDAVLKYRELAHLYKNRAHAPYFSQRFTFVTVTVPKNATQAEKLTAINAALPKGWPKLTSTSRQYATGAIVDRRNPVKVVTAWELDTAHGARPTVKNAAAWGPRHNLVETYVGSSNHR